MKLTIEMPWGKDLTVNHMRYGAGGLYRKKPHVQEWMDTLRWTIATDVSFPLFVSAVWKAGRAFIAVDFRYPDKRRRDTHNYFKVISDAVAAGLGIDDKDLRISAGTAEIVKANPGFTIMVSDDA